MPSRSGGARGEFGVVDADLLLIHGFWSSPATWDRLTASLGTDPDLTGLRIHAFGYESPRLPRWSMSPTRIPDYNDIAQSLPAYLAAHAPGDAPLVVVTHSQGGLILQRFLAWMLAEGRGRELARIRTIVMLACPNEGSEYLASIRAATGLDRNPQAAQLDVLAREVGDARRTVLRQIVHATALDDRQCPIPVHVYAGRTDNIVTRQSAQSAFPTAEVLPGDHFTILNPDGPGNLTLPTLKRHILTAIATSAPLTAPAAPRDPAGSAASRVDAGSSTPMHPAASDGAAGSKYSINIGSATGVVIGDGTVQTNYFGPVGQIPSTPTNPTAPPPRRTSEATAPRGPSRPTDSARPLGDAAPMPDVARDEHSDGTGRVFISYAHDDDTHTDRVRRFWRFLREQDIDAVLDLPAAESPRDWTLWMGDQLRRCRHVLVIGSPAYKRRAQGEADPDDGRGVQWEAGLIRAVLYEDQRTARRRVIPVVLPGTTVDDLPDWLTPATSTYYRVTDYTVEGAEKLLRFLTDQPYETTPALGTRPHLPPRT